MKERRTVLTVELGWGCTPLHDSGSLEVKVGELKVEGQPGYTVVPGSCPPLHKTQTLNCDIETGILRKGGLDVRKIH